MRTILFYQPHKPSQSLAMYQYIDYCWEQRWQASMHLLSRPIIEIPSSCSFKVYVRVRLYSFDKSVRLLSNCTILSLSAASWRHWQIRPRLLMESGASHAPLLDHQFANIMPCLRFVGVTPKAIKLGGFEANWLYNYKRYANQWDKGLL